MQVTTLVTRKIVLCVVALAAAVLTGCATTPSSTKSGSAPADAPSTAQLTSDFSRSKLIAADFVATMTQLPESKPSVIVLKTNKPSSRFGELLLSALQGAGYDLRIGDTQSQNWLGYNANRDDTLSDSGNPIYTFIVSAGEVKLKRSYEVDAYGVKPAGSMFVRGATTDDIVLDESIFSVRTPNAIAQDDLQNEPFAQLAEPKESAVSLSAVPLPKQIVGENKSEGLTNVIAKAPTNVNNSQRAQEELADAVAQLNVNKAKSDATPFGEFSNMYETRESRYKGLFDSYDVVQKDVYVFANDSLILGKQNKVQMRNLVKDFNSETDVMSVIGCSHGKSKIENGNAYLANNRALRVKEEFVLAGLDANKVLEEGCWAPVDFPELPARGVLVQHRRLK